MKILSFKLILPIVYIVFSNWRHALQHTWNIWSLEEKNSIGIFCGDVWNNHFVNVLQNKKISKKIVAEDKFFISQGSVTTQLRCGGIFNNHFTTNFLQNMRVKTFWKSVNIWRRYWQKFAAYFFGGHPVFWLLRRLQAVINVILCYLYYVKGENQPECQICHSPLTVKHILIDCICFGAARPRYLGVDTLKELFENVECRNVVAFIKDTNFLYITLYIRLIALILPSFYLFF